jgi:hypothetical protein
MWLFYRAFPFFLIHETSVINDRVNPFFSFTVCASQSPRTWNETCPGEAQRVPDPTSGLFKIPPVVLESSIHVPQAPCIICIYQIEDARFVSKQGTVMQVRLAEGHSIPELPMSRGDQKTCIAYLSFVPSAPAAADIIVRASAPPHAPPSRTGGRRHGARKFDNTTTHMRRSPGVVRLDIVKPDERVFPTAPTARGL